MFYEFVIDLWCRGFVFVIENSKPGKEFENSYGMES